MPSASRSAVAHASAADVWTRLADLTSWPHLLHLQYADESVTFVDPTTGVGFQPDVGKSGAGANPDVSKGAEFVMKGRLSYRLFARVTDWQPERRLEFEIHRSEYPSDRLTFGRAIIAITLEPLDENRTRVTCEHTLWGRGPAGRAYAATVMRPFLKSNVQRIVDGLCHQASAS
jgi:hypothetical protein